MPDPKAQRIAQSIALLLGSYMFIEYGASFFDNRSGNAVLISVMMIPIALVVWLFWSGAILAWSLVAWLAVMLCVSPVLMIFSDTGGYLILRYLRVLVGLATLWLLFRPELRASYAEEKQSENTPEDVGDA